MDISRRDFLQITAALGMLGVGGNLMSAPFKRVDEITATDIMDFKSVGKVSLLHICDMHAHIKPLYWREPSTLLSAPNLTGTPGFLCGKSFDEYYGVKPGTLDGYFDTYLNFESLAKKFGKMGGIAHIKSVVDEVRRERGKENVLLLDSGDTWQGTSVALKTSGEAMVEAQNYLGVDVMVGHWEFTYGKKRVKELIDKLDAQFISQNIIDNDPFSDDFEDLVFEPYIIKEAGGAKIGIIGQSFPFTATANPRRFTKGWSFGLRLDTLQQFVDELRKDKKVDCVVLLSHDGFSVDQEVAHKIEGIDFILSGHTHDPSPKPIVINKTVILIAGSHGKFVGRLDIEIKEKKVARYNYKLIPIASNLIKADAKGTALVDRIYKPYNIELDEVLGKTNGLLYKRDTFYSTFDALIGEAIHEEMDNEITFTPGYRWGTTLLPGDDITMDNVYEMTAITYPQVYTFELQGAHIEKLLEDIADNVFNANPLYQQGGDMSRLNKVTYDIKIGAKSGKRISNIKVNGLPIDAKHNYKVSAWGGNLQNVGKNIRKDKIRPVYDITADFIRKKGVIDIKPKSNVNVLDVKCGCPKRGDKC